MAFSQVVVAEESKVMNLEGTPSCKRNSLVWGISPDIYTACALCWLKRSAAASVVAAATIGPRPTRTITGDMLVSKAAVSGTVIARKDDVSAADQAAMVNVAG